MSLPFIDVPTVQLRYKSVMIYRKFYFDVNYSKNVSQKFIDAQKLKISYSGIVTKSAQKRIAKAVDMLLMISPVQKVFNPISERWQKFQLTFVTLTIADNTKFYDAKFCYESLLKPFIRWLVEKKGVKSYIWKLELQERGQPHYHLTTNQFIRYDDIKNRWNHLQKKLNMLEDYHSRFGSYSPNSTDIHAVYQVRDIKKYLVKYLSKSEQNETAVNSKIWDCSVNLKSSHYFEFEYEQIEPKNFYDFLCSPDIEAFKNEHCEIFKSNKAKTVSILNDSQKIEFNSWYNQLKNYQPKPKKNKVISE